MPEWAYFVFVLVCGTWGEGYQDCTYYKRLSPPVSLEDCQEIVAPQARAWHPKGSSWSYFGDNGEFIVERVFCGRIEEVPRPQAE